VFASERSCPPAISPVPVPNVRKQKVDRPIPWKTRGRVLVCVLARAPLPHASIILPLLPARVPAYRTLPQPLEYFSKISERLEGSRFTNLWRPGHAAASRRTVSVNDGANIAQFWVRIRSGRSSRQQRLVDRINRARLRARAPHPFIHFNRSLGQRYESTCVTADARLLGSGSRIVRDTHQLLHQSRAPDDLRRGRQQRNMRRRDISEDQHRVCREFGKQVRAGESRKSELRRGRVRPTGDWAGIIAPETTLQILRLRQPPLQRSLRFRVNLGAALRELCCLLFHPF